MKKINKVLSVLIVILLLISTFEILYRSDTILNTVSYSIEIWINNIFPSLFPFFVLSEILINYGFVELFSELFKPVFEKAFKISSNASFIFIMSMLTGFPSNAKYTKQLYLSGKINLEEANKILMFSHFSNPLFILGTVSLLLSDKIIALKILFAHYITNIIIGLIFRNYNCSKLEFSKFSLKKALSKMHYKIINSSSFGTIMTNALKNAIDTLLLILGVVTTFLIISTIINNIFDLNIYLKTFLSSFLEMTQGLKNISLLNISNYYKSILIVATLSFGGLSVHMQIISILSDTKIKYTPFLIARILHVIISMFIVAIL